MKAAYEEIKQEGQFFFKDVQSRLQVLLSLYGCRELPCPDNLERVTLQIAKFQFQLQPSAAVSAMKCGITIERVQFWKSMPLGELFRNIDIANISNEQLCDLLRFITGCGVCIGPISVTFNGLDGLERRPMSHTCSNTIDLPLT